MNQVSRPILSLCMVVKNEAQLLGSCLETLRDAVDEIVIVDTGSTDRTMPIAKRFGAQIISHQWDGSFGKARNLYIENAKGSWILVLDGDERIAKKDLPKLKALIKHPKILGYFFPARNYTSTYNLLWDWSPNDGSYPEEERFSKCPGWSRTKILRLFQRKEGVRYQEKFTAHVDFSESLLKHTGRLKESDFPIHHFQWLKGGDKFIAQKQAERLKAEIKHATTFPQSFLSHMNASKTLFNLGKDREAIGFLKKAMKIDSKSEQIYLLSGMIDKENKNYKAAIRNLKKAIRLNPYCVDAWIVLGMAYESVGKFLKAEKVLSEALRIRPSHPLAYNSLGIVYQKQKRFLKAEEAYQEAIKIHPQHPNAFFNLGTLYEIREDFKKATRFYQLAVKANPNNLQAKNRFQSLSKQEV